MQGKVVEYGTRDYNGRSYKVCVTKTGYIIMRTAHQTPLSTKQYLSNELTEAKYQLQHSDDFNKLFSDYMLTIANGSYTEHTTESYTERQLNDNAENIRKESKNCSKEQTPDIL